MQRVAVVVGGTLALLGVVRIVGAERLAGVVREIDRSSGLFTTWGTGVYARFAHGLLADFYQRVASDVAAALDGAGAVLDVGTGPGLLALEIARRRPHLQLTGVDIATPMLNKARANAQRASLAERGRFEAGEAAHLPVLDSTFDLVLSTLSLHHWTDLPAALSELHRGRNTPTGQLLRGFAVSPGKVTAEASLILSRQTSAACSQTPSSSARQPRRRGHRFFRMPVG